MKPLKKNNSKLQLSYENNLKIKSNLVEKQAELKEKLKVERERSMNIIKFYISRIDEADEKLNKINNKIAEALKLSLSFKNDDFSYLTNSIAKYKLLAETMEYQSYLQVIDTMNIIRNSLDGFDLKEIIDVSYEEICKTSRLFIELHSTMTSLVANPNKQNDLESIVLPSFIAINKKLATLLEGITTFIFKQIEWPVKPGCKELNPKSEYNNFAIIFPYLFKVTEIYFNMVEHALNKNIQVPHHQMSRYIYVDILVKPLEKRYLFHFHGTKPTNRLDKPEWGFNQIITWISDHKSILDNHIIILIDEPYAKDIYFYFISALSNIVTAAILKRLDEYLSDECVFTHLIDQMFNFVGKLEETTGLSDDVITSSPLSLLNSKEYPHIFNEWRRMQRSIIVKIVTDCLRIESSFIPRFINAEDIDSDNFPEIAYVSFSFIKALISKINLTKNLDLQLKLAKFTLNLIFDIFLVFIENYSNVITISNDEFNKFLILCNASMFLKIRLTRLKLDQWYILLTDDENSLTKIYDDIYSYMFDHIQKQIDKIISLFLSRLDVLSAGLGSAYSSYGIATVQSNILSIFKEINDICKNRIFKHLCREFNQMFMAKFIPKLDSFLKHSVLDVIQKSSDYKIHILEMYNTYIVQLLYTYLPPKDTYILSFQELLK